MYKKVKVIFYTDPSDTDDFADTYSIEYDNCMIDIKGNHFVIQVFKDISDDDDYSKSIEGHIFNLNEIKSYKAKH